MLIKNNAHLTCLICEFFVGPLQEIGQHRTVSGSLLIVESADIAI